MNPPMADFDVAVLGAGASGLCAAAELSRRGCSVVVLEARERIGGRIHTLLLPDLPCPVELGAEFIHGEAPLTSALVREAGSAPLDTAGNRLARRDGRLTARGSEFAQIRELLQPALSQPQDQSVEQFLEQHAGSHDLASLRSYVRRMVEGFDAADPRRASVKAIAAEWSGSSLQGGQTRPLGGYGALMAHLARALDPVRSRLMLGTCAEHIAWDNDRVRIGARGPNSAAAVTVSARRAIVTLPVSALKRAPDAPGAVRFEPALGEKRAALDGLAFGPVIKVVLRFRRAFWESLHDGQAADVGFLHAPEAPFPTVWSALPRRVPLLTAWMGGPRTGRLAGASREQLIGQAAASVQQLFGEEARVTDELLTGYVHDWNADPHAQGAYCYVTVGGSDAAQQLARPLRDTLYFAGEAAHPEHTGTVEAALQSGLRAAREVVAAMRSGAPQ